MEMTPLFINLTEDQATTYGLVLAAHGHPHLVKREIDGWKLLVPPERRDSALDLIGKYLEENRRLPPADDPERPGIEKTYSGVWVSLFLLAAYLGASRIGPPSVVAEAYGASARLILQGEIFRATTALTLHADLLHLVGNMVGIAIFGTAVCNITGSGVGWLMILASGIVGNLANAVLHGSGHLSIGASTAVFGALGILAAYQFYRKIGSGDRPMRAWLPLAGGLALMGFLGTGPHADLSAHLFGFLSGILLGLYFAHFVRTAPGKRLQHACQVIAVGLVSLAWLMATA